MDPARARCGRRHGAAVGGVLADLHALFGQLLLRALVLGQARQAYTAQHVGRLGELNIVVADDLDAVAPWIQEIEEGTIERGDAGRLQSPARRLLVVDHETEMAAIVRRLLGPFLKGAELVAQIYEGHAVALAAQLELEKPARKGPRLLYVAHHQRDMLPAH